jgi:hypothetical protein
MPLLWYVWCTDHDTGSPRQRGSHPTREGVVFTASALMLLTALCASPAPSSADTCGPEHTDAAPPSEKRALDVEKPASSRPALLSALYGTYAGVQALDVFTTVNAVRRGAREVNPAMGSLTANVTALSTVKAATTLTTLYFVDRLWREHRVGAVLVMIGTNAAVGAVAVHNVRVARRLGTPSGVGH